MFPIHHDMLQLFLFLDLLNKNLLDMYIYNALNHTWLLINATIFICVTLSIIFFFSF